MQTDTSTFGPFRYDRSRSLLLRGGVPVAIGRPGILLLDLLLRRRGEVVGRSELLDAAWPGKAVEESNLSVQIAQLRRRIGDGWIHTIERVGYQFVLEAALPNLAPAMPMLAILPVADLGNATDLARVLTDDLITALARFGSLRVMAAGPAERRGADYLLEGSVRRENGQIEFTARLIAGPSATYRWAERYETPARTLSTARDGIVQRLASSIDVQIELQEIAGSRRKEPETADAYDLYRRAQFHLRTSRPDDYATATALLERALAIEPENVAFLAAMCDSLHHRMAMGWPALTNNDADRCRDYALRGLRQTVSDAAALALFGISLFRTDDKDWGYAVTQRAAALNPASLTALVYAGTASMHWGGIEEALAHYHRALHLDPHDPAQGFVAGGLARIGMMEGRFEDALGWAQRSFAANPNYGANHWTLVAAHAQLGKSEESARYLRRFRQQQPGVTVSSIRNGQQTRSTRMATTLDGLERAGLPQG